MKNKLNREQKYFCNLLEGNDKQCHCHHTVVNLIISVLTPWKNLRTEPQEFFLEKSNLISELGTL